MDINLPVKEIYKILCPSCKKKLEELVKEKVTNKMVEGILEEKKEE